MARDARLIASGETEAQAVRAHLCQIERATPEFISACLALFIAQTTSALVALETAIAKGAAAEVALIAHRIKGSCATAGAVGMQARCARIESLARSGTLDGADAELRLLGQLFHSLSNSLAHQ